MLGVKLELKKFLNCIPIARESSNENSFSLECLRNRRFSLFDIQCIKLNNHFSKLIGCFNSRRNLSVNSEFVYFYTG